MGRQFCNATMGQYPLTAGLLWYTHIPTLRIYPQEKTQDISMAIEIRLYGIWYNDINAFALDVYNFVDLRRTALGKVKDLTNQKFGRLTAIIPNGIVNGNMTWICKCECGGEKVVRSNSLLTGKVKSCGCLHVESAQNAGRGRLKDLTGQRFGQLVVIRESGRALRNERIVDILWECQCDCGEITIVRGNDLRNNNTQSCGCVRSEAQSKSGEKQMAELLDRNIKEGTQLGLINSKLSSRNKSGVKGVCWSNSQQKWKAALTFQGKAHQLGIFDNIEDAAKARARAEEKYFEPILKKYGRETTES